jgi:hypothetical protein
MPYDFQGLQRVRPGGITLAHGSQARPWEEGAQGRTATVGEVIRRFSSLIAGQGHACRTHQEDVDDACAALHAFNMATLDAPPGATPVFGEAATPHAPPNPPTRTSRATPRPALPKACWTTGIVRASGHGRRQPCGRRGRRLTLPHNIRIKDITLQYFRISRPYGRLS